MKFHMQIYLGLYEREKEKYEVGRKYLVFRVVHFYNDGFN